MRARVYLFIPVACLLAAIALARTAASETTPAVPAGAGSPAPASTAIDSVLETLEVERDETKGPEHPSLRFLKDNRVFVRSQLDRLKLRVTRERSGDAILIDERFLHLAEMSAAIAAARDTIGAEQALAAQRSLFASITELGTLEASLDLMDSLLVDQRRRLLWLEQDFLGHQETALVIVVRGVPREHVPASIVIAEGPDITRVALTPAQCASLAQGGIAQVYHEFVEPRAHTIHVSLEGPAWGASAPSPVAVAAARDRLTFLELDLSRLEPGPTGQGPITQVWYR
jgi:hypothetical protein